MMNEQFELLKTIIESRRSVSWAKMNGKVIPDETVSELLALADWAPTHGKTEPWRFFVYGGESLKRFGKEHANLYWDYTDAEKRQQATYDKLLHNVDLASHLVIAVTKRGENIKIPQLEEIAATAAAIQNVLLGATTAGIASFWSSGGMTHSHALKTHLDLGPDDVVMGLIYLGYTDEPAKSGVRNIAINEKVKWL
jgi:nitroreductase